MNDHPAVLVLMIAVGLYVFSLWRQDYLARRSGQPNPRALPGATPASIKSCVIAALGALVLLAGETWGELHLAISQEQSNITVLFGLSTLVAAFTEELIFRGFIVIDSEQSGRRWAGILGASVIFAALHPFLWKSEHGEFTWIFTTKSWFSTTVVFIGSLWFYAMRFVSFNPQRSLLPCIAAHVTKNIGVLAIKVAQGHIAGWW